MIRTTMMSMTLQHSGRRGISLLEILFSIFILSVGLLGLASLIPAGTADVSAANVADRAGNIGRAAFREVQVRNFTNHEEWRSPMSSDDRINSSGNPVPPFINQGWIDIDDPSEPPKDSPVDEGHSICIDPLFIARSDKAWRDAGNAEGLLPKVDFGAINPWAWPNIDPGWPGRAFPYYLDNDPKPSNATNVSPPVFFPLNGAGNPIGPPRMTRVTLRSWSSKLAPMMGVDLADRIFRWHDDLLFDLPTDDALRPTATPDLLQRGQSEGNYTWMVTLTPVAGEEEVAASERTMYTCSVVVFYKRNLDMPVPVEATHSVSSDSFSWNLNERGGQRPSERIVLADFLSPGVSQGGGDVRLRLPLTNAATNNDPADPEKNDFTNIRPNNWILISGYKSPSDPSHHDSAFQWFRVLSAGEPTLLDGSASQPTASDGPEWIREVTLVGADWDSNQFWDVDDSGSASSKTFRTSYATLVEGVVAVFTKTISVETAAKH